VALGAEPEMPRQEAAEGAPASIADAKDVASRRVLAAEIALTRPAAGLV